MILISIPNSAAKISIASSSKKSFFVVIIPSMKSFEITSLVLFPILSANSYTRISLEIETLLTSSTSFFSIFLGGFLRLLL